MAILNKTKDETRKQKEHQEDLVLILNLATVSGECWTGFTTQSNFIIMLSIKCVR